MLSLRDKACAAVLFAACGSALAAPFQIAEGHETDVCLAYYAQLESLDDAAPLMCERPLSEAPGEVTRPASQSLDIYEHQDLFKDILFYLDNASRRSRLTPEEFKGWLRRLHGHDRLQEFIPPIDIDNDGTPDRVAIFRAGRCRLPDGLSQNYRTVVLILNAEGKSVNRERTDALLQGASRRYSTMLPFVHRGRVYFDFWASAESYEDRDYLYVFAATKDQVTNVCQYRYEGSHSAHDIYRR